MGQPLDLLPGSRWKPDQLLQSGWLIAALDKSCCINGQLCSKDAISLSGMIFILEVTELPMSDYYKQLRQKIGTQLIFSPGVAAIIRNQFGEILFQRPSLSSDIWSLPAGAIEIGETPAEAIIREVYEETGLHVVPHKLLGVFGGRNFRFTYPDGNQVESLIFVFECIVESGELEPVDGESA
jgi:ADP-ribose pyrophosphatase YjhB (NUDIX family)